MKQPLELKAYFRDLVEACGGTKRAAEKVGGHASHISEAMAAHVTDRWPRLDHVAILEADCCLPIVTRHLADTLGFELSQRDSRSTGDLPHVFATAMKEMAEVQVAYVTAVANHHVDAAERAELVKQANHAIAGLQDFIVAVRGTKK